MDKISGGARLRHYRVRARAHRAARGVAVRAGSSRGARASEHLARHAPPSVLDRADQGARRGSELARLRRAGDLSHLSRPLLARARRSRPNARNRPLTRDLHSSTGTGTSGSGGRRARDAHDLLQGGTRMAHGKALRDAPWGCQHFGSSGDDRGDATVGKHPNTAYRTFADVRMCRCSNFARRGLRPDSDTELPGVTIRRFVRREARRRGGSGRRRRVDPVSTTRSAQCGRRHAWKRRSARTAILNHRCGATRLPGALVALSSLSGSLRGTRGARR
jgi:hypothetical protein